jgi:hypothetical protein
MSSAIASFAARQTSDVFPYRRGAYSTTFWPLRMSATSSAMLASRFVKDSSSAMSPKRKGFGPLYTVVLYSHV